MKEPFATVRRLLTGLGVGALVVACAETIEEPEPITSVELTSPLGALLDVGGSAQLTATARNGAGAVAGGVSYTWTSSDPSVVSTSSGGFIEALAVGTATIRVAAGTAGASLAVRVVDADLPEITRLAADPFVMALVGAPSTDLRARIQAAMGDCRSGAGQGRLEAIQECISAVEVEVTSAGDPTDRVLLAVLSLFVDRIKRMLNL